MGKTKTLVTIVIVLALLLVVAVGYIVFDKYKAKVVQQQVGIYQQGIQQGQQQALNAVYQQALTCKPTPIVMNNQTINIIAVECLQQA